MHSKAARAFFGLPRNTPDPGLRAETNWLEPRSRAQIRMIRMYHRLMKMCNDRLTKKIFLWGQRLSKEPGVFSTWSNEVNEILQRNNLYFSSSNFDLDSAILTLKASLLQKDQLMLKKKANHSPKLRDYVLFAGFFEEKSYLSRPLSFTWRKLLAK